MKKVRQNEFMFSRLTFWLEGFARRLLQAELTQTHSNPQLIQEVQLQTEDGKFLWLLLYSSCALNKNK